MILRVIASLLLLTSILFWPFWISVILGLAFMAYFSLYVEAVFLFLLSDLLFGAVEAKLFGVLGVSFFVSIIFFVLIEIIKTKLRLNTL